jgi:UDP-N-acetylmuramoyl-L-alanyl-D-glutamate--2,6-diaminopimelate ligase
VIAALEHLEGAPGRLQRVGTGPRGGEAYVDYAHTPDGLETVLRALRPHARRRLLVVPRRRRRPGPGQAAADGEIAARLVGRRHRDRRQSRGEIPPPSARGPHRAEAHESATGARRPGAAHARQGDCLVVAGKGHEQGQIVGTVTHRFDDVTEVMAALEARR